MVGYSTGGQNISGQFGMPLFGIQGTLPPFTGNYFWVDGTNGSDGNTGGPQDPFKTLTQALAACLAGNNDVVFFNGTFSPSATFTWNKNNTHLIGLSLSPYATPTISVASTTATSGAFSPLVNVTASGCIFQNISVVSGINQAATQVAWAEAGGKNTYIGVNINQVGHATAGAQAGNRALTVASYGNFFSGCVLGSDAIVRATGNNANMEWLDGAGACIFQNCVVPAYCSNAADLFITTASTALTGSFVFNNTIFINNRNGTGGAALTTAFVMAAASLGTLIMGPGSVVAGAADISGASNAVYLSIAAAAATGNTAIVAT